MDLFDDPLSVLIRLLAPGSERDAFNDWRLIATAAPSLTEIAVLVALAVLAVLASAVGTRRLPARRRIVLTLLRAVAAVAVVALFLRPAVELRAVSRVRTRVALLIDASRSMTLATKDGTRAEVVVDHLRRSDAALAALSARALVEPALFGVRAHPIDAIPESLEPDEGRTDLGRALADVSAHSAGRDLGAVILYSDGADNQGLTTELARRRAEKLGAPIYTIGFDVDSAPPDLAIRRVVADEFAFVHNTVKMEVEIEEQGFALDSVDVTLRQDSAVVQSKRVMFAEGSGRVTFEFKPRQTGKLIYRVDVPVQEREAVESNNSKTIVLKVIRDRIRVLQVVGRPSWDERFLREHLKRNPNVDLISFFILRSTTDMQKAPQEELALIPFPVNDLFTSELSSFDVVIYQNFSYRPYHMAQYLRNVREYVEKGGSFLMIGGDSSLEDGFYSGTPIEEILPVRLAGALPYDHERYKPRLTKQGRRHPIMQIGEPGEPADAALERLPDLEGMNSSSGLAPGAQALLVHPGLPGNPPVVAVRELREGMSMLIATDSTWFWRFVAVGEGGAGREYDRFFGNALRWLTRDPELARVRIEAERSVVPVKEQVRADVLVLGPDYRGLPDAAVIAKLVPMMAPDGQGESDTVQKTQLTTGPEGTAVAVFSNVPPGTYALRVEAAKDRESIGRAQEPIVVQAADVELEAPLPRPDLLRALADASDGAYVSVQDDLPALRLKDPQRIEVDRSQRVPIWDTFPAFFALLALAGAEWWLRRRWGLL